MFHGEAHLLFTYREKQLCFHTEAHLCFTFFGSMKAHLCFNFFVSTTIVHAEQNKHRKSTKKPENSGNSKNPEIKDKRKNDIWKNRETFFQWEKHPTSATWWHWGTLHQKTAFCQGYPYVSCSPGRGTLVSLERDVHMPNSKESMLYGTKSYNATELYPYVRSPAAKTKDTFKICQIPRIATQPNQSRHLSRTAIYDSSNNAQLAETLKILLEIITDQQE